MPQTVATDDADCLSWPNTSREMFWASHGEHCFYDMRAFSLTGFEFQKFHHICILSFINFLSLLISLMTLCIILSATKDLFFFPPEVIDTSCEDLWAEGAMERVDHHPKSETKEDDH